MKEDDSKFYAPDAAFILALAQAAITGLPDAYRTAAKPVALRVQEFVSDEHFEAMGLEDPYELNSLSQRAPDVIWLFRRPILDEWAERGDICLADLVGHVLMHELAHHFGWNDDDVAAIDPRWE